MLKHLLSSGTVSPAASVAMVCLPFWQLRGDKDPVLFGSAHPIAGLRLKDSLKPFSSGQDSAPQATISPFLECPQHYIIPERRQHSAQSYCDVFSAVPIRLPGVLHAVHYILESFFRSSSLRLGHCPVQGQYCPLKSFSGVTTSK